MNQVTAAFSLFTHVCNGHLNQESQWSLYWTLDDPKNYDLAPILISRVNLGP